MSLTDAILASYRQVCQQTIIVRRYTGAGANRPRFDATVRGNASAYASTDLVGGVAQGDQRVIVLVEDIIARQMSLPVTTSDKVVVRGQELAIQEVKERNGLDGTLIAYELQARG